MEREKATEAMKRLVVEKYQCDEEDVSFPGGLSLGTTWESGQDFQADYTVSFAGKVFEGQVYWSTVSEQAYL